CGREGSTSLFLVMASVLLPTKGHGVGRWDRQPLDRGARSFSDARRPQGGPVHALAPGAKPAVAKAMVGLPACPPKHLRRRVPAGTPARSEIVAARTTAADTSYRIHASCRHGMTSHERLFHETRNLGVQYDVRARLFRGRGGVCPDAQGGQGSRLPRPPAEPAADRALH